MICTKFVFIFLEYLEYEKDWLGSNFVNDFISTGIFNDEVPEITQLRLLIVRDKIPETTATKLLKILKARLLPTLPSTCKAFLDTESAKYKVDSDGSQGEFIYLGIENGIKIEIKMSLNDDLHSSDEVELIINIDGFKPFKSSKKNYLAYSR